jgi:3-hydroxybutyryl-CoA dehydrogenase
VAQATARPGQVIGLHFFNPATVQKLVEVVPSVLTASDTVTRARAFVVETLGKTPISDTGMVLGCAQPMGPLKLADLIGLDTLKAIADAMYEEYKEPLYAAPPLLLRMTAAGLLGRKSGRGFYDYSA